MGNDEQASKGPSRRSFLKTIAPTGVAVVTSVAGMAAMKEAITGSLFSLSGSDDQTAMDAAQALTGVDFKQSFRNAKITGGSNDDYLTPKDAVQSIVLRYGAIKATRPGLSRDEAIVKTIDSYRDNSTYGSDDPPAKRTLSGEDTLIRQIIDTYESRYKEIVKRGVLTLAETQLILDQADSRVEQSADTHADRVNNNKLSKRELHR